MTGNHFLLAIPSTDSTFFAALDAIIEGASISLRPPYHAFRFNLDAVWRIITVPYRVAHLSLGAELEREVKELIRAALRQKIPRSSLADAFSAKAANLEKANKEIAQRLSGVRDRAISGALCALENDQLRQDIHEIFLQSLVLAWGALEVLVNDVFRILLNAMPQLSLSLRSDSKCKNLFENLKFDLKLLSSHGFNLRSCMGDVLLEVHRIDGLETMRAVFAALFGQQPGQPALHSALGSDRLRLLNCRRHLIVHRRGVIDEQYIRDAHVEPSLKGSRLVVSPADVPASMEAVRDVAIALLEPAASLFDEPSGIA
jgi:hypothetical protein